MQRCPKRSCQYGDGGSAEPGPLAKGAYFQRRFSCSWLGGWFGMGGGRSGEGLLGLAGALAQRRREEGRARGWREEKWW